MLFDLEVEFVGPFLATHGTGDFGQWFGLTENPLLAVRDPEAYQHAQTQEVPFPEGYGFEWFYSQRNRTSVVYTFDSAKLNRMKTWARPVSPPPASPGVCRYVRQILRDIFWSRPGERDRCRSLFATSPELLDFFAARDGEAAAMGREHGHGANEDPNIDVSVRGQEVFVSIFMRSDFVAVVTLDAGVLHVVEDDTPICNKGALLTSVKSDVTLQSFVSISSPIVLR